MTEYGNYVIITFTTITLVLLFAAMWRGAGEVGEE